MSRIAIAAAPVADVAVLDGFDGWAVAVPEADLDLWEKRADRVLEWDFLAVRGPHRKPVRTFSHVAIRLPVGRNAELGVRDHLSVGRVPDEGNLPPEWLLWLTSHLGHIPAIDIVEPITERVPMAALEGIVPWGEAS